LVVTRAKSALRLSDGERAELSADR